MRKILFIGVTVLGLVGCASGPSTEVAREHYETQRAAMQRPLVQMVAQPGETITLGGVAQFSVYAPLGVGGSSGVQMYREAHHPGWSLLGDALRIAAPIYLGGQAAIGLADVVGRRVGDVAMSPTVVQQPSPLVVEQPPYNDPIVIEQPPYNDPIVIEQPPYNDPIVIEQPILVTP